MVIFILEPYLNDSHKHWAEGFKKHSTAEIKIFSLPAKHWKWRMHASAITLADKIKNFPEPDHIMVSDMCDLSVLKANLPKQWKNYSCSIYFHENQITFPWKPNDQDVKASRNNHYGFINYTSALASDVIFFNSKFHKEDFLQALPSFLDQFPDFKNKETISKIEEKSFISNIGIHPPSKVNIEKWNDPAPKILWNHRWEYDKNPESFFKVLMNLKNKNLNFELIVTGNHGEKYPEIFDQAKQELSEHIIHWGYFQNSNDYSAALSATHVSPVTSVQDYFGISFLQAVSHQVYPLIPNRLIFPDHLADSSVIYHSDDELESKLEYLMTHWEKEKVLLRQKATDYSLEVLEKYNWNQITDQTEQVILNLKNRI